jgi:dUTP pyrophosphatase
MGKMKEFLENLEDIEVLPVKIMKTDPEAVIPQYAKPGDAGLDLTAIDSGKLDLGANGAIRTYRTGIAVAIPEGYVGLIFPRSSVYKSGMRLCNSVGVIDSGYRGEIIFKFDVTSVHAKGSYQKGDRIGQLIIMPYPTVSFEEVEELNETDRGEGRYGSSGR